MLSDIRDWSYASLNGLSFDGGRGPVLLFCDLQEPLPSCRKTRSRHNNVRVWWQRF